MISSPPTRPPDSGTPSRLLQPCVEGRTRAGVYPNDPLAISELLKLPADCHVGHLYCCNPARSLCGRDLDPADAAGPLADGEEANCRVCMLAHETVGSCGARLCRLRSWWRDRFDH